MGLFPRKKKPPVSGSILQSAARQKPVCLPETQDPCEPALSPAAPCRPVIDAAIRKDRPAHRQLSAGRGDSRMQEQLDEFEAIPVGLTGQSLQTFADAYLDSLLYLRQCLGNAHRQPHRLSGRFADCAGRAGADPTGSHPWNGSTGCVASRSRTASASPDRNEFCLRR
ncbi:MAG: hypothetical protein ACLR5S_04475 [Ruminococcus sp.]